jgi:hypothetical protein
VQYDDHSMYVCSGAMHGEDNPLHGQCARPISVRHSVAMPLVDVYPTLLDPADNRTLHGEACQAQTEPIRDPSQWEEHRAMQDDSATSHLMSHAVQARIKEDRERGGAVAATNTPPTQPAARVAAVASPAQPAGGVAAAFRPPAALAQTAAGASTALGGNLNYAGGGMGRGFRGTLGTRPVVRHSLVRHWQTPDPAPGSGEDTAGVSDDGENLDSGSASPKNKPVSP